jgi:hypothetical protein
LITFSGTPLAVVLDLLVSPYVHDAVLAVQELDHRSRATPDPIADRLTVLRREMKRSPMIGSACRRNRR